jgi:phosphomannomutase
MAGVFSQSHNKANHKGTKLYWQSLICSSKTQDHKISLHNIYPQIKYQNCETQ